jgi:hypothetical protein
MSDETVATPYGLLDRSALEDAAQSFDTRTLLRMVEELDRYIIPLQQDGGLRDQLLRLHSMASTVIDGAGLSVTAGESLPDLASDAASEVQELIETLQGWLRHLQVLKHLASGD